MLKDKLKQLRNNKDLTQQQISKILNVTQSAYGFYETGNREPKIDSLIKLADFFDVSIDYLVDRKNSTLLTEEVQEIKRAMSNVSKSEQIKMLNTLKIAFPDAFIDYPTGYKYPIGFTNVENAIEYLKQHDAWLLSEEIHEFDNDSIIMMANNLYNKK